ncbi:MAG TPA: ATP-binding protein [Candidatus Limnocylindrales bacterium]|nr:ATP-binding protein [Candidatus Limnocylindrales bacterium]
MAAATTSGAGDGLSADLETAGLVAHLPAGALTLDAGLRVVAVNQRLASITGRTIAEIIGQPFEALLSTPARILFQTHVAPALLADGRVEEVFLTLAGAQEPVPILLNIERTDGPGDVAYAAVIVRIRARSQWERELLATNHELELERVASRKLADELAAAAANLEAQYARERQARDFQDAFVGVVSHELRTPITTIYGMSHLLRARHRAMSPEDLTGHLQDIETEADRLRRLTEDLLVLSRAEGGRLEAADDPLVIGHVVRAAVQSEGDRSEGHTFEAVIEPELPLVLGDATYVEQVLRNFLSNAVKYSPAGTTVRTAARQLDGGVQVTVTDEGPGLGDEPTERLWSLFFRTRDAIRQASGAGIGLFVSRALIEAMGGRVWARSATERATGGAEFGFWLPAAPDPGDE